MPSCNESGNAPTWPAPSIIQCLVDCAVRQHYFYFYTPTHAHTRIYGVMHMQHPKYTFKPLCLNVAYEISLYIHFKLD